MGQAETLFGMSRARGLGVPYREISPWSFGPWKAAGMTHVCLACWHVPIAFKIDGNGNLTGMEKIDTEIVAAHGPDHDLATLENLQQYDDVSDWVKAELKDDCRFLVAYPSKL